ncbi:MAG: AAA domain-containing protein [Candidatus Omnitrophota bacterium]
MDAFTRNYLSYLRDCVRLVNRDSPVDFGAKTTRGEIHLLSAADIRQIETSQSLQTDNSVIMRWKHEFQISAEGECFILFGFMLLAGKQDQAKFCCPLLIAETDVSSEGANETRLDMKQGTLKLYTPALSLLLSDGSDGDADTIAAEIDKIAKATPFQYPFSNSIDDLVKSIRNSVREERRTTFSQRNFTVKSIEEDTLRKAREGITLSLLPTAVALKIDALPDFSVEKEINEIIKSDNADCTSIPLLMRQINQGKNGSESSPDSVEPSTQSADSLDRVLEVLTLSNHQREAIAYAASHPLTVISGPPGTGKSHTIASLAINLAYNGKTVLVTSKTREAVSVVVNKLQELGGKYVVAHVGDKSQKKEFANLIKGILHYENLNRRQTANALEQARSNLHDARQKKKDTAGTIKRLEDYYGQYHSSRSELDKLADAELPEKIPGLSELEFFRKKAEWARQTLARPRIPFAHKLRTRAILNQIKTNLALQRCNGHRSILDSVDKSYYSTLADGALGHLNRNKNIRTLWLNHAEWVDLEHKRSCEVFECWRKYTLSDVLYSDQENTPRLRNYANALETPITKSKKKVLSKILEGTDSSLLLRCFPIWACTSNYLGQALKLESALFDYAIIDEASLCDPATAVPALYRAKYVVVVGDEKQLKHRTAIAVMKLQMLTAKNELDAMTINDLNYSRSVYEIAASRSSKGGLFMLDEHFRSLPPIIAFSNTKYYEGRLKVMRRNPANEHANVIEFHYVRGTRNERRVISEEYDKALEMIYDFAAREENTSLGIITMTEEQAKYMNARFSEEEIIGKLINQHNFKCGSPQSFQGDQRHTIILCLGIDADAHQRSFAHVNDDNRFNVAVTRATDHMIVISSIPTSDFIGNMREYFQTAKDGSSHNGNNILKIESSFESNFEREVYETLVANKLNVVPQYESCGYRIDFVVTRRDRFVAVEVDGPQHFDAKGNYVPRDVERTLRLMRGGWQIERISCYEWERGLPARKEFVERINKLLF